MALITRRYLQLHRSTVVFSLHGGGFEADESAWLVGIRRKDELLLSDASRADGLWIDGLIVSPQEALRTVARARRTASGQGKEESSHALHENHQ